MRHLGIYVARLGLPEEWNVRKKYDAWVCVIDLPSSIKIVECWKNTVIHEIIVEIIAKEVKI